MCRVVRTKETTTMLTLRLNKLIGRPNGIKRMVEEDSPCEDVFTQMNAVNGALHRMSFLLAGVVSVLLPHMWVVGVIGRARRPTRRR